MTKLQRRSGSQAKPKAVGKGTAQKKDLSSDGSADDAGSDQETFFRDSDEDELEFSVGNSDEEDFNDQDDFDEDTDSEEGIETDESDFDLDSAEETDGDMVMEDVFESDAEDLGSIAVDAEGDDGDSDAAVDSDEEDIAVPATNPNAVTSNPLLKFFWSLPDLNRNVRLQTVIGLVNHLLASQANHTSPDPSNTPQKEERILSIYDGGRLSATCCSDLTYSIKRLIKGLMSNRAESRTGFALALIAILDTFSAVLDASVIVDWVQALTSVEALGGSIKRRQLKDMNFGRIFAFSALFKSGLGVSVSLEDRIKAMDLLLVAGKKSALVRETMVEVIAAMLESSVDANDRVMLITHLNESLSKLSVLKIEHFQLILYCHVRLGYNLAADALPEFLSEFSDKLNLLAIANKSQLHAILAEVPLFEHRVHSIWSLILGSYTAGRGDMATFASGMVCTVFLNSSSVLKRRTGLLLIAEILNKMAHAGSSIQPILTPTVIRFIKGAFGLLNLHAAQLAGKEVAALNKDIIAFFANFIAEKCTSSSALATDIIISLSTSRSTNSGSDKSLLKLLCSEEVIKKLYDQLNPNSVICIIDDIFLQGNAALSAHSNAVEFQAPLDRLIALLRMDNLVALADADSWIAYLIQRMVGVLLLPELNVHRAISSSRLQAVLIELGNSKRFGSKDWNLITAELLEKESERLGRDEPTSDSIKTLKKISQLLEKGKVPSAEITKASRKLVEFMRIMVFLDPIEFIPVIKELYTMLKDQSHAKNLETSSALLAMTDMIISFLALPSQFCRKWADAVFQELCPILTEQEFVSIINVLLKNDEEIFEQVEEDLEEEEEQEEPEAVPSFTFPSPGELSDDDVPLNDEDMAAFDAKLAQIFKAKRQQASAGTSSRQSLSQMKFKVLDLVSLAFKSQSLPNHVRITVIPPFLNAIKQLQSAKPSQTQSQNQPLFAKFDAIFMESYRRAPKCIDDDCKLSEATAVKLLDEVITTRTFDHAAMLNRVSVAVHFCLKSCRGSSSTFDDTVFKTKFTELIRHALGPEERRFKILKAFIFNWANWEPKFMMSLIDAAQELKSLLNVGGGLKTFQRNQLIEFLMLVIKKSDPALVTKPLLSIVAQALTASFPSAVELPQSLQAAKLEVFRDELKFLTACHKKHAELDSQVAREIWLPLASTELKAFEAHWNGKLVGADKNQSAAIKSFLGQVAATSKQINN